MRRYIRGILGIVRAYQLRFVRDKVALFFTFLFPVIFLLIFGTINSNSNMNFSIALINESDSQFASDFAAGVRENDVFSVSEEAISLDDARERMGRGEFDSVVVLPEDFGSTTERGPTGAIDVYYSPSASQAGQTVAAVMEQVLDGINQELGQPAPQFTVSQVSTGRAGLTAFDYTFSGLLGFTILGTSIFGLANVMPAEKQRGSFRRLRAAPFKSSQLVVGNALHYVILTMLSVLLMVLVGLFVFDFTMRGSWLQFGVFAALSSVMMIGFGLLVGGWARNENQAAPLTNLIAFPLMFLSGIFFPRFLFPEWLQQLTGYIPLSPVVDGFRQIMTENASLFDLGSELGLIILWTLVVYAAAIKLFRWE